MIILKHQSKYEVLKLKIFDNVNSLDDLDGSITNHYMRNGNISNYEDKTSGAGGAQEIYCEFFIKQLCSNVLIGIHNLQETSSDKYKIGLDFFFTDSIGRQGAIQVKWSSSVIRKYTRKNLTTFEQVCGDYECMPCNSVFFTNLKNTPTNSIFCEKDWEGKWLKIAQKKFRVLDRSFQEEMISRDPSFWTDLRETLKFSCQTKRKPTPTMREHQELMIANQLEIMKNGGRGQIIAATGGGKTLVEYMTVFKSHFELNKRFTIMVAPKLDLINQHFAYFSQYGIFDRKSIHVINFCSGDTPEHDINEIQLTHSLNRDVVANILNEMESDTTKHIHIFVTYKSLWELSELLKRLDVVADCTVFDEYHNLIIQDDSDPNVSKTSRRNELLTFPSKSLLFYSASIKRGRLLSAFDVEVFGKFLANISYKYLREQHIVVQKLRIAYINTGKVNIPSNIRGIIESQDDSVDVKKATLEIGGILVAFKDSLLYNHNTVMVAFTQRVAYCKLFKNSEVIKEYLGNDVELHLIHADTPSRERQDIYEKMNSGKGNHLLLQHSCVVEGVDIPCANSTVICRSLGPIEWQQGAIGRVARTPITDYDNCKNGTISTDSPVGWEKYSSTIYILIDTESKQDSIEYVKDLIGKLQYSGLTQEDYEFVEIKGSRHGDEDEEITNGWMTDVLTLSKNEDIDKKSLSNIIEQARVEYENDIRDLDDVEVRADMRDQYPDLFI